MIGSFCDSFATTKKGAKNLSFRISADSYVANNVTVYLTANWGGWENPLAYVFDSSNSDTPKVAWPGEAMSYVGVNDDNDTIFSYTVDINTYDKLIFSNGNSGDNNQTVDINISTAVNGSAYYFSGRVSGENSKINAGTWSYTSSALTSNQVVYVCNGQNWSNPKFYVFNSSTSAQLAGWPGIDAKWVANNEYSQGVYRIVVDRSSYDAIIFNGSGGQTVNIYLNTLTSDHNAFYLTGEIEGGNYKVGQWTYSRS